MKKYSVVITQIRAGAKQAEVIEKLAAAFGTDAAKVARLLANTPRRIKSDLVFADAKKWKIRLEKTGVKCQIREVPVAPAPSAGGSSGAAPNGPPGKDPAGVCPNCGYQAFSADDPLISAHDGMGECPQCGAIPKRVLEKKAAEELKADYEKSLAENKKPVWKKAAAAAVVLILIIGGGWWLLGPDSQTGPGVDSASFKKDAKEKQVAEELAMLKTGGNPAQGSGEAPESDVTQCVLPLGTVQTVTVIGYAPVFHNADVWPDFEFEYKIYQNAWEKHGLPVYLGFVVQGRETFRLPHVETPHGPAFSFFGVKKRLQLNQDFMPGDPGPSVLVFSTNDVHALLDMENVNEDEYLKHMNKGVEKYDRVIWYDMTVYRVRMDLQFNIPDEKTLREIAKKSGPTGSTQLIIHCTGITMSHNGKTKKLTIHPEAYKLYLYMSQAWKDNKLVGLKLKPYKLNYFYTDIQCPGLNAR